MGQYAHLEWHGLKEGIMVQRGLQMFPEVKVWAEDVTIMSQQMYMFICAVIRDTILL